jgi:segregation and condensation protein B
MTMPEPEAEGVTTTSDTRALEALLFVSDEPLASSVLAQALEMERRAVEELCDRLAEELDARGAGVVLRNVAGGWRLFTHPDTAAEVERFVLSSRQARLTKAALETLAIVAYKQPVTRHQITSIRGVNSDGVLRALQDKGLVEEAGREETPGRPILFATTPSFLEHHWPPCRRWRRSSGSTGRPRRRTRGLLRRSPPSPATRPCRSNDCSDSSPAPATALVGHARS